ncbi:AAA ATPase domain-containing protein [Actinokineospora alba]|uniref:AAA ATPase domain-containing protein n=1 Tax=Actinokineospora alba TaxID=504798 RepID=A0A1H0M7M8_9PSEU|nr:AAA family ATPase [Actinokineospora alba]TDP67615.1 AAA ATPase-like protein [Actinokineospora alba]SDI44433.1 AAA ATPase domain-containing protein [Actinokineospora alba]SDO76345.1 AAA ATPase domain-containing protein [Actinokineospora alba]
MLIRLIGLVAIEEHDKPPRRLSSAQTQVAFARLVMERATGTDRDQLADTLWPDGLPDTWASALRSVVSRVRTFVSRGGDDAALVAQGRRYLLRIPEEATVDLECAERAVGAAVGALERGAYAESRHCAEDALAYLGEPFLPHHEGEWVEGVRDHVDGLLCSALETASAAAAALGADRDAVRFADEAVRRAPLSESAHRCLMTAHAAGGNRAEALRAYQRLRQVLSDELGIDPSPRTQAAYVELLGGPAGGRGRPRSGEVSAAATPFSGRRAELAALADSWARAEQGGGHLVLVTGEPGVGKTRLVTEAARRIGRAGGLVVYGRGEPGATNPYQPVVQALADFVAATPAESLPLLGAGPQQTLRSLLSGSAELGALTELLVAMAREPVCLVLDDLDLADEDTFLLLRRVFRLSGPDCSMLVMATAGSRAAHRRSAHTDFVHDLDSSGLLRRITVPGLEESDVRALSRQLMASARAADAPPPYRLLADTAGNAYLTVEMLRWYRDGAPEPGRRLPVGVHDYADASLAAVDAEPRRLLRAAAVAGFSFELDLAADAACLTVDEAMDALDALVGAGLVTEVIATGYGAKPVPKYRYTHDVVRRAVYEQLSETRRRWLHARLADAIEHRRADTLATHSRALAHHRSAGADADGDTRAVQASWHAAAWAGRKGAQNEAVRLLEQALAHVPVTDTELRADALTRLGLAQLAAGRDDCDQTLLDGTIQALHTHRLNIAAQAALGLADAVGSRPRLRGEAAAMIDLLLRTVAEAPPPRVGTVTVDDVTVGRLLARRCTLTASVAPDPALTRALPAMIGELRLLEGPDHVRWRATLAGEALTVAVSVGDSAARVAAAHHRASTAELSGDLDARDTALAALAEAVNDGVGDEVAAGDALLAEHAVAVAVTHGRLTDAAATARHVESLRDRSGAHEIVPAPGSLAHRQMLIARWLRHGGEPIAPEQPVPHYDGAERALAAILRGDRGLPHLTVRALAINAEPMPTGDEWPHAVGVLALCAVELGDPATAEAVRNLLLPYPELTCGVGYRSFVGTAALHLGRLAVVTGDWDDAERHLSLALSQLAGRRARPWMAVAQHALAKALENRGKVGDHQCAQALRAEADWTLASLGLRRSA